MAANSTKRRRVQAFLTISERELSAALDLLPAHPTESIFLLQQSVEKIARAMLEEEEVFASKTHSLAALADMLPGDHPFQGRLRELDPLSGAATRYRYPGSTGRVFDVEAAEVQSVAAQVIDLLRDAKIHLGES